MNVGSIVEFFSSFMKSTSESTNNEGAAYGSAMAGAPFDPIAFIKKPQVIMRIVNIFFSILVFGSIITVNDQDKGKCPLNGDPGACGFGTVVGVFAFITCLIFIFVDARFDNFSNILTRKRAVIFDLGLSGIFSFIWFICFCYLTDAWRNTSPSVKAVADVSYINTAIAFSFFSIITWGLVCLLNFLRLRQGISTIFSNEYEEQSNFEQHEQQGNYDQSGGLGGMSNQHNNDTFRQAPFNKNQPMNNNAGYQQPNYPNSGYQQPTY